MNRIILTVLLVIPSVSSAQKFIYINGNVGNYWMNDMKELQEELEAEMAGSGIPVRAVHAFPVSFQGEMGMDFTLHDRLLREYRIGGFLNYTVTEGLITYSDYSGRVDVTQ